MEALTAFSLPLLYSPKTQFTSTPKILNYSGSFSSSTNKTPSRPYKVFVSSSSLVSPESADPPELKTKTENIVPLEDEKFDWFSHWYPIMPVGDLDKKVPHGKKVMGLDIVVWWDKNESSWRVFDDACPHRLAPLSDGRIDKWGRLQCAYHGWCFNGSGHCKLIPQAPPDGPPVHTFKKACVGVYPSTVQHDVVWFWPNKDPESEDIIKERKKIPYIPELDDPTFNKAWVTRDVPYGYEVLIENLMDPAHIPYAHYGIMERIEPPPKVKVDREGGRPLEIGVNKTDINGVTGKQEWGTGKFVAPCLFYIYTDPPADKGDGSVSLLKTEKMPKYLRMALVFLCIPVSPGNSRFIWSFPRNFSGWIEKIFPQWIFHIGLNLVVDSDLHLLHMEERKIMEVGSTNWQKACFVPARSDAFVVGFRKWMNKYSDGQINWRENCSRTLPPTPPREQLMDRYWSHVVNCRICSSAYKSLNALEVILQIISIVSIGIVAATNQNVMSAAMSNMMVVMAIICFVASRWLAHFVYKNFHYHGYNHALIG